MTVEIERKFLIADDSWRRSVYLTRCYRQGYLADSEQASVRVRSDRHQAYLNIKAAVAGTTRLEYEYPVALEDGEHMLNQLCGERVLEKTRHWVRFAGHVWEIDEFEGANHGLIMAEIELNQDNETFDYPPWLGREVTDDVRFYNNYLARHPYAHWQ